MANAPPPGSGSSSSGISPEDIWNALLGAGASAVQAAGIMGNAIAESSLNPEARALDTNGYYSNGLWQFNEQSYPSSGSLVTGNPAADLAAQVTFLTDHGGLQAASGTTVSQTAGNFASNFERCASCQSGGTSYVQRVANASQVSGWAAAGTWPTSTTQAATTATLTSAQASSDTNCAWSVGWGGIPGTSWLLDIFGGGGNIGSGEVCLISKPQLRAIIGTAVFLGGALLIFAGFALAVGIKEAPTVAGLVGTAVGAAVKAP